MDVLDMYKIAENEKIGILDFNWTNSKAKVFEIDKNYYIALNNNIIDNSIEEKEVLAEELGHYYCNALYYLYADKISIAKCEKRALKWAYSVLVPLQRLKEKISEGFDIYQLSEYFNVDVKYMLDCIDFYVDKYGILV